MTDTQQHEDCRYGQCSHTRCTEAERLAKGLHDLLNRGGAVEAFLGEISRYHRTIQQGLMREIILPLLKQWATDHAEGRYDLRNEDTVKFCAAVMEASEHQVLAEVPLPYFRFI